MISDNYLVDAIQEAQLKEIKQELLLSDKLKVGGVVCPPPPPLPCALMDGGGYRLQAFL
jgi:hypothetical protein